MSIILSPKQFSEQKEIVLSGIDFAKAQKKYEDNAKFFITVGTYKAGKSAIKVLLQGELSTEGVTTAQFNGKANYSFGLILENEDLEAFEVFTETLVSFLNTGSPDENWEVGQFVKDDKIYLKLKADSSGKKFPIISNVKLEPKKLTESGLYRGQKVAVHGELGVYVNWADKKAGLTFNVRKLDFDLEAQF